MNNAPISWSSKAQRSVTLCSNEAEYVILLESAKEVKLIFLLLKSMILEFKLPITVRVDNVGAIFMSENVTTSNSTKHVDNRYRFVNEFVEDRFIKIIFLNTKDNVTDIFTKNTSGEIWNCYHNKMVKDIETKQKRCYKVSNLIYGQRTDEQTKRQREQINEQTKNRQRTNGAKSTKP